LSSPEPSLDRRQLLKLAAAGAAAWASGCPNNKAKPPIPKASITGQLRGQDPTLGHLLRDRALSQEPPSETREAEVLILGGGVAGLSAAWRLRREGVAAPILEAAAAPGGNSRSGQVEGVSPHPWGAHYLRAPTVDHPSLETFLEEAGLIRGRDAKGRIDWDTRALCLAPMERVWESGLWGEGLFPPPRSRSPKDVADYKAFGVEVDRLSLLKDASGKPAFAIPIDKSSQDPELLALDQITFREWLTKRGLTSPGFLWYVEYACRDDYGCSLDTTSAWAGLHYFCSRNRGQQTRDETLAWPEGNARLVQHLQELHGPTQLTPNSFAYRIIPGQEPGSPSEAWVLHVEEGRRRSVRYRAQELVWAGPNFVLDRLLGRAPTPGFSYAPWLIANVVLRALPGGFGAPLAWDNVPYGKPSLGYVVANRERVPGHPLVVTWYLPFTGADDRAERARLYAMDHAAVVELVTSELLEIHPALSGEIISVDSWRWGHAMARPTPGFIWGGRQRAREGAGALIQAHSDLSGISVFEEAFYQGVVAGEEVLKRRGTAFSSIL
jgi:putative NAD(P)-binding protein